MQKSDLLIFFVQTFPRPSSFLSRTSATPSPTSLTSFRHHHPPFSHDARLFSFHFLLHSSHLTLFHFLLHYSTHCLTPQCLPQCCTSLLTATLPLAMPYSCLPNSMLFQTTLFIFYIHRFSMHFILILSFSPFSQPYFLYATGNKGGKVM